MISTVYTCDIDIDSSSEPSSNKLKLTTPKTPWNIRESAQKLKESLQKLNKEDKINSEELESLQNLFSLNGLSVDTKPEKTWNIKPQSTQPADKSQQPKQQIKLSDLQKLLEENGLSSETVSPDLWNIRESGDKFRNVKIFQKKIFFLFHREPTARYTVA